MDRVFLVPGFFGFAAIGEMQYFAHVRRFLERRLPALGLDVAVHEVPTLPTAGLERRARRLATAVATRAVPTDRLHLVGHSTGGLDARLLVGPTGGELAGPAWERLRPAVRTVTSVACPHAGAPVADFFATVQGAHILHLLSLMTLHVMRLGSFATEPANLLLGAIGRAGSLAGVPLGLVEDVRQGVLRDFDADRRAELEDFFGQVNDDRSLLSQLRPQHIATLRAALGEAPGVAYGSVAMMARRPPRIPRPPVDPSHLLFRQLHALAGFSSHHVPALPPRPSVDLRPHLGLRPELSDNDGMVPTLSQVHGTLLHGALGDHLDVLGYFDAPAARPPHVDWMRSRSRFSARDFTETWEAVARWIARAATPGGRAR